MHKYIIRRIHFNLSVYGRGRPYFSKNKKIILQNFGLLAFFQIFYSMFLLYYFLFLDKTYNNQILKWIYHMSQAATGGVPQENMLLKSSEIPQKNTCVGVYF